MNRPRLLILFIAMALILNGSAAAGAADATPIPAPGPLKVQVMSSYIEVSLSDVTPTGQYTIIEKSADYGEFYTVCVLGAGYGSFKDYGVANGHLYRYRAKRYDSKTTGPYSNEVETLWLYPTGVSITRVYSDQIDLEWTYPPIIVNRVINFQTVIERRTGTDGTWTVVHTAEHSEREYRDHGLMPDTVYYYRIRTLYPNGQYSQYIPYSDSLYRRTSISLVTPLTGFAMNEHQIRLEWDVSALNGLTPNIQKMNIAGDFVTIHSSAAPGYYLDWGLMARTDYTYRIFFTSANGSVSGYSEPLTITTETISSPSDITVVPISEGRVSLSWTYPHDTESGFEIWRKERGGTWQMIGTVTRNVTSWIDYSALPDRIYTYRVRAVRGDTVFSGFITSGEINNADPDTPPPLIIVPMSHYLLIGTDEAPPPGVTYTLESRTDINDVWKDHTSNEPGRALRAYFLPLTGKEFDIRLRADNHGKVSYGEIHRIYSSVPEAPFNLRVVQAGSNRVLLAWSDNTEREDGYNIYRITGGTRILAGSTENDVCTFADTGVTPGSAVKYEVSAYNTRGESQKASVSANVPRKAVFKDISGLPWAADAIDSLCSTGVISQSADGMFYPGRNVTLAEFVTILLKAYDIIPESSFLFSLKDVQVGAWYHPYLMTAVKYGILVPDTEGRVVPLNTVSKGDAAVILSRMALFRNTPLNPYGIETLERFTDGYNVRQELKGIMASLAGDYIMPAQNGQPLNLDMPATRAEAATIIYRFRRTYR